jgi:hypothetical protein
VREPHVPKQSSRKKSRMESEVERSCGMHRA